MATKHKKTPQTEDIKYPEEIRTETQARILKLSEIAKLHELKSILKAKDGK